MGRYPKLFGTPDLAGIAHGQKPAVRLANEHSWDVSTHLDLVLNSLTDHAILTLDVNGHVTSWNNGAQRTQGYQAEEIIGRHFCCFYSKADQDVDVATRALRLARDLGKHDSEGWRIRRDGALLGAHGDPSTSRSGRQSTRFCSGDARCYAASPGGEAA